jgi:hypothetical protein
MLRKPGRKLLVASIGVAAVSYVACGTNTVANLAPPPQDGATDTPKDNNGQDVMDALVANLAPPPQDAGIDANDATVDAPTDAPSDAKGG